MHSTESKAVHFRAFAGNSSTRTDHNGVTDLGAIALTDSLLAQLNALVEQRAAGRRDEEMNRRIGQLTKVVLNQAQEDFERIFIEVANARLPKHIFLALNEEARMIWRGAYSHLLPPLPPRKLKKARRYSAKKAGNA